MGNYRYRPDSPLTRWQQEKVWALCRERSTVVMRRCYGAGGPERPGDKQLQRHLEREIDWYHMKEAKPGLDHMRAELRSINALNRRVHVLIRKAGGK